MAAGRLVIEHRDAELPQVAPASHPPAAFAHRLHRGDRQCQEHGDDRDHDEQFDEREGVTNETVRETTTASESAGAHGFSSRLTP